ncbi:het domain containing protein [Moniliophthora roreri]|uniref:Heterokaryon incompatibility domain-containing protein n=1 Tax=Moniliophthora roreri TaxID=221103 RepID=A0A0W0F9K4_MONRR|nr:het domain containing protein [Moniliophthora roreri]
MLQDISCRCLAWLVGIFGYLANIWKKAIPRSNEDDPEAATSRNEVDLRVAEQLPSGDSSSASITTEGDEGNSTESLRLAYSIPLDALQNTTVDLTSHLTEKRYRFIDADAFVHNRTLVIHERSSLPDLYTVISYVWFGLIAEPSQLEQEGSFRVSCGFHNDGMPREDGGPISLKVLEHACRWASNSSSSYLWLDRLCILQTSKQDKAWQISRMYDIYEGSEQCIVLPGGLQRLASVFDETSWADRAWTYQEAIVTWDYAVVLTRDWYRPKGEQHWLVDGECHWQYLQQLFVEGDNLLTRQFGTKNVGENPCLILGRNGKALNVLRRIVEYKAFNHLAVEGEETISQQTIRQLVLQGVAMRTSSRPVDMALSILGLVGVEDAFRDRVGEFQENERFRATLTLVEAMLCLEEDENDDFSVSTRASSTLVDLPLWQSLELVTNAQSPRAGKTSIGPDTAPLPSLRDLAQLLDNDNTEHRLSHHPDILMKRGPLPEWAFEVEQTEDSPNARALAIAAELPEDELLRGYRSDLGQGSVVVHHETEGFIELCRKLELKQEGEVAVVPVVFGWSLKLDRHPYIRFYKFDISHLLL